MAFKLNAQASFRRFDVQIMFQLCVGPHNFTYGVSSMPENFVTQIETAEEQLRHAMLASDVKSLDALISPSLVFITHFGSVLSKQDDLEIHRSGALKFQTIELSEQRMLNFANVAYVSVRAQASGTFNGSTFQEDIRFSRVWQRSPNSAWQVVAGQATVVQA